MMAKCEKCGATFDVELAIRKEDKLEITYFLCKGCGFEWVTLVTDPQLRKNIKRVNRMREIASTKETPLTFRQKCQNLLKSNVERGRVLVHEYLSEHNNVEIASQP